MRAAIRQVLFGETPFSPRRLFLAGEQGVWYDVSDFATLFQDSAGTTPVTAIEQPVGLILDKSGRGNHASQSTTTSRPILRNRYNLLTQTDSLSTQSITSVATSYTLRFSGTGTVTLSGTATGTLSAGITTFSATAGTLTLTVSGTVANGMLTPANESFVPYQWVTTGAQSTSNPVSTVTAGYDTDITKFQPYLSFDGTDDWLATGSIDFSATDKMSVFAGMYWGALSNTGILLETSVNSGNNNGTFYCYVDRNFGPPRIGIRGTASSKTFDATPGIVPLTRYAMSQNMDLSTANAGLRLNGSAVGLTASGTTSPGNFAAAQALYIGRRAGTSLPFAGRIYSLIIRGALTNSPQLEQTERWVATKTGVAL